MCLYLRWFRPEAFQFGLSLYTDFAVSTRRWLRIGQLGVSLFHRVRYARRMPVVGQQALGKSQDNGSRRAKNRPRGMLLPGTPPVCSMAHSSNFVSEPNQAGNVDYPKIPLHSFINLKISTVDDRGCEPSPSPAPPNALNVRGMPTRELTCFHNGGSRCPAIIRL